ncbi:hypothetical protein ACTXT7_008706 [Hymenolepis weldensis]
MRIDLHWQLCERIFISLRDSWKLNDDSINLVKARVRRLSPTRYKIDKDEFEHMFALDIIRHSVIGYPLPMLSLRNLVIDVLVAITVPSIRAQSRTITPYPIRKTFH